MKYSFKVVKYIDAQTSEEKLQPVLDIEDSQQYGCYFYDEINNLSSNIDYVNEIVFKLEAVLKDELTFYNGFGYEVYMIECDKEFARVKNVFENENVEAVIPTKEIYAMMRDWRDYLALYQGSAS